VHQLRFVLSEYFLVLFFHQEQHMNLKSTKCKLSLFSRKVSIRWLTMCYSVYSHNTWSKIMTKGRIAGADGVEDLLSHRRIQWSLMLYAVIDDWIISFGAKTAAETADAVEWIEQERELPLPLEGSGPYWIHGSLGLFMSACKWHLNRVSRFLHGSRTCPTSIHTDIPTDRPCYSVFSKRSLSLAIAAM